MKNELNKTTEDKSIAAVQQYITLTAKSERHEAYVLINTNGKESNPGVKMVFVAMIDDVGKIIIENIDMVCPNEFTTQNSSILIYNKTLHIESKDMFSNRIVIEITAV